MKTLDKEGLKVFIDKMILEVSKMYNLEKLNTEIGLMNQVQYFETYPKLDDITVGCALYEKVKELKKIPSDSINQVKVHALFQLSTLLDHPRLHPSPFELKSLDWSIIVDESNNNNPVWIHDHPTLVPRTDTK